MKSILLFFRADLNNFKWKNTFTVFFWILSSLLLACSFISILLMKFLSFFIFLLFSVSSFFVGIFFSGAYDKALDEYFNTKEKSTKIKSDWYKQRPFIVFLLIFIIPLGIAFLYKFDRCKNITKHAVTFVAACYFTCIIIMNFTITPSDKNNDNYNAFELIVSSSAMINEPESQPQSNNEEITQNDNTEIDEISSPEPESFHGKEPIPQSKSTNKPIPATDKEKPTKKTTKKAKATKTSKPATTKKKIVLTSDTVVWISKSGSKYHLIQTCSNMKTAASTTVAEAEENGKTPCAKCITKYL